MPAEANSNTIKIRDLNALEHITSDIAKSRFNYESILNGLVLWNTTKEKNVTVRLATDSDPGFVEYTFASRASFVRDTSLFLDGDTYPGAFDPANRLNISGMSGDTVNLRVTVESDRPGNWTLYRMAEVHDAVPASIPDGEYRYVTASDGNRVQYVKAGESPVDLVSPWSAYMTDDAVPGKVVIYGGAAYVRRPGSGTSGTFSDKWERFAENIDSVPLGNSVVHGMPYLYVDSSGKNDGIYIYTGDTVSRTSAGPTPYTDGKMDTVAWTGPMALVRVSGITSTMSLRDRLKTDIAGYILRVSAESTQGTVYAVANISVDGGTAEPKKGLAICNTCNYAQWPDDTSKVWNASRTDNVNSAAMVFHHADASTKNTYIINYDGPDIDGGLKVYLPVVDKYYDGSVTEDVRPVDGATMEFMFRIWPNAALNGHETPDLTINKAHIYVLSAPVSDDLSNAQVIAKFSMARLTNFYVWSENIAVPNRPVFYKARFVYSASAGSWKTWDYYQVPDHVFLSPKGFVDPSVREGDGGYDGVETAGFPLMQDPFGGLDMGAVSENQ